MQVVELQTGQAASMQQAGAYRQREELLQQELTGARSEAAAAQRQAVQLQHDYDALQAERDQLRQTLTKASASSPPTSAAGPAEAPSNEVRFMHSQFTKALGMGQCVLPVGLGVFWQVIPDGI